MSKVFSDAGSALKGLLKDNMTIAAGGFGLCGIPENLIRALVETPDGLGYYVRLNEEKFGGKVVAIERDRVRFSVREQDPGGQTRVRTVELKLN